MKTLKVYNIAAILIIGALSIYCSYLYKKVEKSTLEKQNIQADLSQSKRDLNETANLLQMCEEKYYKSLNAGSK